MLTTGDEQLEVAYRDGTRRLRTPEETLRLIQPAFPRVGITRLADVTHLDRLGIHTCCAIRPTSSVLQVSNGKGTSRAAAMASAAMESIELFHAENPDRSRLILAAESELDGNVINHRSLNSLNPHAHLETDLKMHWVRATNPISENTLWVPASNIYFNLEPAIHRADTNGLASGNHPVEAALHALYEVLERDAGYLLSEGGKINLRERARIIDPTTIEDPGLRGLLEAMDEESDLKICHIDSRVDVHTFWVILLNRGNGHPLTMLNPGWGTHRDPVIAASRAITEAAQSRLTNIHGAREDIMSRQGYQASDVKNSPAYRFFSNLKSTSGWQALPTFTGASTNLADDWTYLLEALDRINLEPCLHDLTDPDLRIPVVKVIVPGLGFNQRMF